MQTSNQLSRIIGRFAKQYWSGPKQDQAVTIDTVPFDATYAVLSKDLDFVRSIRDNDYTSDEIGRECVDWSGPHEVYVAEAIAKCFGFECEADLERLTQEQLDQARTEFHLENPDLAALQMTLKITYRMNGVSVQELLANLNRMVAQGIGNGMLTGENPAEVEEYKLDIVTLPVETVIEEVGHEA